MEIIVFFYIIYFVTFGEKNEHVQRKCNTEISHTDDIQSNEHQHPLTNKQIKYISVLLNYLLYCLYLYF